MFAFHAIPVDTVPVETFPIDVVPSALQTLLYPLCEGIVVGLVLGIAVLLVMNTIERLLARRTDAQTLDAQLTETQTADTRRPAPRPPVAPRGAAPAPPPGPSAAHAAGPSDLSPPGRQTGLPAV